MGVLEQQQVADQIWRKEVDAKLDEHFERLDRHDELIAQHERQFTAGRERMSAIEGKIDHNTSVTERIDLNTASMVAAWKNWGGFTTVSKWILALIVGVAALIIAGGVIYWFISTGTLPHKP